jgi:hypothetical protein
MAFTRECHEVHGLAKRLACFCIRRQRHCRHDDRCSLGPSCIAAVHEPRRSTLDVIRRALEGAGVEFIDENGGGPGVRLKKSNRKIRKK